MGLILPRGLSAERKALLEVARAEVGTREDPPGSNAGPVEKYLHPWARDEGPAWCAFFVCWCLREAFPERNLPWIGSVNRFVRGAKGEGWGVAYPQPGDLFAWVRADGTGHIGFVLRVSEDGNRINTIEGNSGDRVRAATRPREGLTILSPFAGRLSPHELGLLNLPSAPAATR